MALVSNRSRSGSSVSNKLSQLDSRVSRNENSQANTATDSVTSTQIATDTITNDNIEPGSIQSDSIARGAIGTEQLGVVNQIFTDSSLVLQIGATDGSVRLTGGVYTPPASGSTPLALNASGQMVTGLDSTVNDASVSGLIANIASATRIALERILASTGDVKMIAGATANSGWLLCDGSAVSRSTYSNLYNVIGTTYGAGDGSTTFNLPNMQGRVAVGRQSGDTNFGTLGATGGEKAHQTTIAEMPAHTHTQDAHYHGVNDPSHNHSQNSHNHGQNAHNHYQDAHYHGFSGTTSYNGDHSHTGPGNGFWYGRTDTANIASGSSARRDVGGNTSTNGGHTHDYSGNTGWSQPGIYNTTASNQETTASNNASYTNISIQNSTATNQNTGGGAAHNNLQPYVVMNYVIRY